MGYFDHKIVWITGATKGIGRALAFELAKKGATLALTARGAAELELLSRELSGMTRSAIFPGDVAELNEMKRICNKIEAELGPVEILIANAGTHIPSNPCEFNGSEYFSLMKINYGGLLNCMDAVVPKMVSRKHGHVVGLSSMAGYRGMPTAAAYGASKSAIAAFLESARFHLAEAGIFTTIVNPGFVRTPLTDKNKFPMPFLIEANVAAEIICAGIEMKRKEISFPFPFNWIMKAARIMPYPLYELIMRKIWKRAFPN